MEVAWLTTKLTTMTIKRNNRAPWAVWIRNFCVRTVASAYRSTTDATQFWTANLERMKMTAPGYRTRTSFGILKLNVKHPSTTFSVPKHSHALLRISCAMEITVGFDSEDATFSIIYFSIFLISHVHQLDCGDFSDETHCGAKVKCDQDQFECENGLCIQHKWVCDGMCGIITTCHSNMLIVYLSSLFIWIINWRMTNRRQWLSRFFRRSQLHCKAIVSCAFSIEKYLEWLF